MKDFIELGSSPCEEDCVQVSKEGDYVSAMRAECQRYLALIRAKCGEEVGKARLAVKGFPHDFGTYYEVVCYFDDTDEEGAGYAFRCEAHAPATWDDVKPVAELSRTPLADMIAQGK